MATHNFSLRCRTTAWPPIGPDDRWERRRRLEADRLEKAWGSFLGRVSWEWFITATFDPKRVFPVSRETASREAFWWCGQVGHIYRRPIAWVYAVERGAGGLWHAHILIIGLPSPRWGPARAIWEERNGRIDIQPVAVGDAREVALYASKSLSFGGEVVLSDTLDRYKDRLTADVSVGLISR